MIDRLDLNTFCFLCKKTVKVTDEHVFPQWLLSDYKLRDQFVVLKNGSKIKYKNVTVPCCEECNNVHLSKIENQISKAIRSEDIDFLKSNHDRTFIWLYKIMYGLNYKEMFLKENIKDPLSEKIVSKKDFFEKHSYNIFPLYARDAIAFHGFSPYSIFVFKLSEELDGKYYYADEPYKMFSSIVLGSVGIVCSFQCDGYIEKAIHEKLNMKQFSTLTVAQFGDFCAYVLHLKSRMKMLPNYLCHKENGKIVFKIQELNEDQIFNNFKIETQIELTTKMYRPLFNKLITKDENGQATIKYKSPFIYF